MLIRKTHKTFLRAIVLGMLVGLCLLLVSCAGSSPATVVDTVQVTESTVTNPEPSPTPITCQELEAGQGITIEFVTDDEVRVKIEGLPPYADIQIVYTASVKDSGGGRTVRYETMDKADGAGKYTDENDFGGYEYNGMQLGTWQVAVVYGERAICSEFTLP